MPTYEYLGEKGGHHFDKTQTIPAKPLKVCPQEECAEKRWAHGKVKRVISGGAGLLFKGSGFYITDYRSEKYKEAAKKDAPASAASGESKGGGGESKGRDAGSKAPTSDVKPAKTESKPANPSPTKDK